jgi:hypothetical protein
MTAIAVIATAQSGTFPTLLDKAYFSTQRARRTRKGRKVVTFASFAKHFALKKSLPYYPLFSQDFDLL